MNESFQKCLRDSGLSMYALAKKSGVPYTTINELKNEKHDINQCASETTLKLSFALGVEWHTLLNPFRFLDGCEGRYKQIRYRWGSDEESFITFKQDGEEICLRAGTVFDIPKRRKYYDIIAEWMIEEYLRKKEWEASSDIMYQKWCENRRQTRHE